MGLGCVGLGEAGLACRAGWDVGQGCRVLSRAGGQGPGGGAGVCRPRCPPQRKPEEQPLELEDGGPEKPLKPSHKAVALNPPAKGLSSAAPGPPKLSPCCHSPALRHPAKCPVALPAAPCTLPVCPAASSAVAPRSPADSPLPVQSKGSDGEDKRGEGQPPRDYPKSLEPGRTRGGEEEEGGHGAGRCRRVPR